MKKVLGLLFLMALFVACNVDNSGYPKKVNFGGTGGTRVVYGDGCYIIGIEDYNGNVLAMEMEREEADSFFVEYDWLRVTRNGRGEQLTITAAPNETNKTRHLYISGMSMDEVFEIKVTQAGGGL